MLAVVEHQEQASFSDEAHHTVHRRPPRLIRKPERACHCDRHQVQIGDRRQVDVADVVAACGCDLNREPCLPRATCSGEGDQPIAGQQVTHVQYLTFATHKTGQLRWKALHCFGFRLP
jgi:hypothetical protein